MIAILEDDRNGCQILENMWSRRELAIYRCGVANRHLMTDGTTA